MNNKESCFYDVEGPVDMLSWAFKYLGPFLAKNLAEALVCTLLDPKRGGTWAHLAPYMTPSLPT